jgi:ribonuclease HII
MPYFRTFEKKKLLSGFKLVAGIDEVGRGSFAGPLVVGVVVYNDYLQRLSGLNDSKKLSKLVRTEVAKKIMKNCNYGFGICWPQEIDKYGMSKCLKIAISRALGTISVCDGINPDFLFIDGNLKPYEDIEYVSLVRGDSKLRSIAAASIIAKVFRDNLMECYETLYNDFVWGSHVGYGTLKHRNLIIEKGFTYIHRKSFLRNLLSEKDTISG